MTGDVFQKAWSGGRWMGHWDTGQGFAMVDQRDDEDLT